MPHNPACLSAVIQFPVVGGEAEDDGSSGSSGPPSVLRELPGLHKGPAASVDINSLQQVGVAGV